jgi:hypothetical protein
VTLCRKLIFGAAGAIFLAGLSVSFSALAEGPAGPASLPEASQAAYPLKVSANHRYLVDQKGSPFLIVGDTPQGLMGNVSESDAERYFADREAHGFNTLNWVNAECAGTQQGWDAFSRTVDGIRPFTEFLPGGTDYESYDLSKPNEEYFVRLDHLVQLAAKHHLFVFLNPMDTIPWLVTLRHNGPKAAYAYGQYLGNRYKGHQNIAWLNGNDFNLWTIPSDDELVQAVSKGIRSVAPNQIQTVELHVRTSSSFDDPRWIPLIELNSTYTYSPTYMQMLYSYHQKPIAPTYLLEAHYELEDVGTPPDYGTPAILRKQEYWTMLAGGAGQIYGNAYLWTMRDGWQNHLDTPGVAQIQYWKDFFLSVPWQDLVPDEDHSVLTGGNGSFGNIDTRVSESDYATAARTPDGSTVVVYIPTARTITIDMTKLHGTAKARWFDPSDGTYKDVSGGPIANSGSHQFTTPGKNHDDDGDWLLLLQGSK